MARVPQYTRTVLLNRSRELNVNFAQAAFGGNEARQATINARQLEEGARRSSAMLAHEAHQKQAEAKVKSQEKFNQFERERIEYLNNQRLERQSKPTNFAKDFDEWHQQKRSEFEAILNESGDNVDVDYFGQLMDRDRNAVLQSNTNWESGVRQKNTFTMAEQAIDDMNVNFAMSNPTFDDFVKHNQKIRDYANTIGEDLFSVQDRVKITEYAIDSAAKAFFEDKMVQDPVTLKQVMEYGKGGSDSLIDFVMNDLEGGGRYVKDGNGYAKYGINSAANPDVDVKNLTPEKAREIYKSRYWDKRLDEFAPAFQAIAFDALVNHGNDKDTWAMIDKANGNPDALISLRQQEYARLIATAPDKYGQNERGWNRRLEVLGNFAQQMRAGGEEFAKNAELIDSRIIKEVRQKLPEAIAEKRKAVEQQILRESEMSELQKLQNERAMMADIYDESIPLNERIANLRKADLNKTVRSGFATKAISYLKAKEPSKKNVSERQKLETYNELHADLQQIRVKLGGTSEESPSELPINQQLMDSYAEFEEKVLEKLDQKHITKAEAKSFTQDFSDAIVRSIEGSVTEGEGFLGMFTSGIKDPYGHAFDKIDNYLENTGNSKNLELKKALITEFSRNLGDYKSSGDTDKDEKSLNTIIKNAVQRANNMNYAGQTDTDNPPNFVVRPASNIPTFDTVEEMEAANLPDGTMVIVGGVQGVARSE